LCTANGPKFAVISEDAERMKNTPKEFSLLSMPVGALKGQYFENIKMVIKYWPRMNSLQIKFFGRLFTYI
jgi:hypothetical protein